MSEFFCQPTESMGDLPSHDEDNNDIASDHNNINDDINDNLNDHDHNDIVNDHYYEDENQYMQAYGGYDIEDNHQHQEISYISSDEEGLDPNSVFSVLQCLRKNWVDDELVEDLINLLENNGHAELACQLAHISLDTWSINQNHIKTIERIGKPNNKLLGCKMKNLWLAQQTYTYSNNLMIKEIVDGKYVDPGTNQTNLAEVDLETIVKNIEYTPSYPDTIIVVPNNTEYSIHRKFHVEPFRMYTLQIKFACSNNLDVSLMVNTNTGENRLSYKLSGSQIQYNFNTLGQNIIEIGLKGMNHLNQIGQLRLIELSLTCKPYNYIDSNLGNRHFSPNVPIVANLYITEEDTLHGIRDTLESVINQMDIINIYLSNVTREKLMDIDVLLHSTKYRIKQGRDGRFGIWNMSSDVVGYQFMIEAGIVYNDTYVALLMSKLLQYNNRAIVGLHGIQLMGDYENWTASKKVISNIMGASQDVRCHILGGSSIAFLSGIVGNVYDMPVIKKNYLDESGVKIDANKEKIGDNEVSLLFAIMAQRSKIGMICVERIDKMIKYRFRDESKMNDDIGADGELLIKNGQPWKYY